MIKIIGALIALVGVLMIYNARSIVKKIFDFGNENEVALGMKYAGFVVSMVGAFAFYFNSI